MTAIHIAQRAPSTLTQNGHHLIVLNHLQTSRDNEAEAVDALAGVVQQITGCRMRHHKVHGQRSQTAVGRQPKSGMLVEHLAVQVHTDVGLHVFRTVVQHLHSTKRHARGVRAKPNNKQTTTNTKQNPKSIAYETWWGRGGLGRRREAKNKHRRKCGGLRAFFVRESHT